MSRAIKFRAWDKAAKEMCEVANIEIMGGVVQGIKTYLGSTPYLLSAEDIELMQYTGLKDKNGTEIYEGDLVEQRNEINMLLSGPYEVRWGHFGFTLHQEGGPESHYITPSQLQVIGNVWESPELLKQGSNE